MTKAKKRKRRQTKGSQGFNRKNSEAFLERNHQKPGVVVTDSGLQYLIIDEGDGPKPTPEDAVVVHQRISLVDGTVIQDTYRKAMPARFTMKEAIEGFREGLLLMSAGARYRLFLPPDLAWGRRGAGSKIGPNAVLIIDARLLEIVDEI